MGACAAFVARMIQKIDQAETEVPRRAAEKMEPELRDAVQEGLNWWYASYNPTYYVRTGGIQSGVMGTLKITLGGNVITVIADSSGVPQHSHDSGDYVFEGAFRMGIHGTSQIAVSAPPWVLYEEKFEEIADKNLEEAMDEFIGEIG